MTVVTISNDLSSTSFIISNDDNIINHVNGDAHDTLALIEMNVESDVLSWMIPYPHLTLLVAKQVSCVKNSWRMKLLSGAFNFA